MPRWEDVNARCRGLGTHLLGRAELGLVEDAVEWRMLPRLLAPHLPAGEPPDSPRKLDAALVRRYSAALAVVERWLGPRRRFFRLVWEDEERRALRALLRGAAEGASPDRRLEGAVATTGLPDRLLRRIARAPTVAEGIAIGGSAGLPLAAALADVRLGPGPAGLLGLELALSAAWAARAVAGARGGGARLRRWVAEAVDAENALALAVADHWGADLEAGRAWLPGGRRIDRARFIALARVPEAPARLDRMREWFPGGPLGAALAVATDPADLEGHLLEKRAAAAAAAARREPLGPGPTCAFLLGSRLELRRLRRASWRLAFGPGGTRVPGPEAEAA